MKRTKMTITVKTRHKKRYKYLYFLFFVLSLDDIAKHFLNKWLDSYEFKLGKDRKWNKCQLDKEELIDKCIVS